MKYLSNFLTYFLNSKESWQRQRREFERQRDSYRREMDDLEQRIQALRQHQDDGEEERLERPEQ